MQGVTSAVVHISLTSRDASLLQAAMGSAVWVGRFRFPRVLGGAASMLANRLLEQ